MEKGYWWIVGPCLLLYAALMLLAASRGGPFL